VYRISLRCMSWAALTLFIVLFAGCGGSGGGGGDVALTPDQKDQIEANSTAIGEQVAAIDLSSDVDVAGVVTFAESLPSVEQAGGADGTLWVQYNGGGKEVFVGAAPTELLPPDIEELRALSVRVAHQAKRLKNAVGNRNAVIINALAEDKNFEVSLPLFAEIKTMLEDAGFDVQELNGPDATPDNMRQLSDCGLVLHYGHGGVTIGGFAFPYAVMTGKVWNGLRDPECPLNDWLRDRVVKMTVPHWTDREGTTQSRSFFAVTGNFWRSAYSSNRFNSALFMNLACSGARYDAYRNGLYDAGVCAYTGWTDPTRKSAGSAWRMLALMLDGKTLQQAYDALPDWYKSDTPPDDPTANLWIGPNSGTDTTLGGTPATRPIIVIDAPFQDEHISGREVTVRGQITPRSAFSHATISVNGNSSALAVDGDGYYSQAVGLRAGDNTIAISAIGYSESTREVSVVGDFSADVLYTSLAWNTDLNDIDLHLQPIEGADGATDDCYFGNMNPSWGASLDVDDTWGFGPEHITARSLPAGTYLLYVHYWNTHGQTDPATVNVGVSVNGAATRMFTLPGFATVGDVWNVCTIEYPSGNIDALNDYYPAAQVSRALREKLGALKKPTK
jgi:uncharacterized protein YfaP (DUF2135 family)